MMDHIKIAPDIDSNPGIEQAGWAAARVFELLLKVSGLKDLRGRLPPECQDPAWLARRWNLSSEDLGGQSPSEFIARGVKRLLALPERVAVVRREGDDLVILGWEKFYSPAKSGAERTADWRARQRRDEAPSRRDGGVTDETSVVTRDATPPPPNTTSHHEDTTPPPPPTPACGAAAAGTHDPADGEATAPDGFKAALWERLQQQREASGQCYREARRPKRWDAWAAQVLALGPADEALDRVAYAHRRFLGDATWRDRGWPTALFCQGEVWASRLPA